MRIKGVIFAVVLFLVIARPAMAAFSDSATSSQQTVSSGTLAAPTGVSAAVTSCVRNTSRQVTVSWTATATTWADGYEVFRSTTTGGPYTAVGKVSGRNTTSFIDNTVAASTTYYYVVQATKAKWQSPNSNQASVTTPRANCG